MDGAGSKRFRFSGLVTKRIIIIYLPILYNFRNEEKCTDKSQKNNNNNNSIQ